MKQVIIIALLVVVVLVVALNLFTQKVQRDLSQPIAYPSATAAITPEKNRQKIKEAEVTRSLFVPYWTVTEESLSDIYDTYFYFGVTPMGEKLDMNEPGAATIDAFVAAVPENRKKVLVLRMIDSESNSIILNDVQAQDRVIQETLTLAAKHGFDGIALDLELSAIPFESIITKINNFTEKFYTASKKANQQFSIILYGDVFYRVRPFDVKALSDNADAFMIMAYDFHKARGNPGPNFPLRGKEVYGYDMTEMTDDFLQFIPAEKLTVIFGLYGYDWIVDEQGNATTQGEAITDSEITEQFWGTCSFAECSIKRKNDSRETEITYTDGDAKHSIWFEDMKSVAAKETYLKEQGISSFSYWANSYFAPILPIDD